MKIEYIETPGGKWIFTEIVDCTAQTLWNKKLWLRGTANEERVCVCVLVLVNEASITRVKGNSVAEINPIIHNAEVIKPSVKNAGTVR